MIRSTLWITICQIGTIILTFFLQIILAARFGATGLMDVYLVASTLPTLLLTLLAAGLNICIIPVFVAHQEKGDENSAFAIANALIILLSMVLMFIILVGIIASPRIIQMIAPGLNQAQILQSAQLFRLLLPTVLFYGLANLLAGVYYARRKPFLPALNPLLRAVGLLIGILLFRSSGIFALAFGDLIGTGLGLLVLSQDYIRHKFFRFWDRLWTPGVFQVAVVLGPWFIGALVGQLSHVLERFLASSLKEGSISYLGYASQIIFLSVTLLTKGLSLTLLPLQSAMVADRQIEGLRNLIARGIRGLVLVIFPIETIFILFGLPLIQLIFERGAFDTNASQGTYFALLGYLGAFLALSMGVFLTNVFYASRDTITVARIAILGFIFNVIIDLILVRWLGSTGLAIGFSLTALLNAFIMLFILNRRLGTIRWWNKNIGLGFFACILSGGVSVIVSKQIILEQLSGRWELLIQTAIGLMVFIACYLLLLYLLQVLQLEFPYILKRTNISIRKKVI